MGLLRDLRRTSYRLGRTLGDINAVLSGKIGSRLANKLIGRKGVSKLWLKGGCLLPAAAGLALVIALLVTH